MFLLGLLWLKFLNTEIDDINELDIDLNEFL